VFVIKKRLKIENLVLAMFALRGFLSLALLGLSAAFAPAGLPMHLKRK
jgi:hypothetical protein